MTGTSSGTGTVDRSLMSSADTVAPAGSVPDAWLQQKISIKSQFYTSWQCFEG